MKVEFVYKILPAFFVETSRVEGEKSTCNTYFFLSFVEDINDRVQLCHEKVIIKQNYWFMLIALAVITTSYFVSFWVMLAMVLLYLFFVYILYFTEVGVYHRDIRGYSASIDLVAENKNMTRTEAIEYYSKKIMKSQRYGDFVNAIGVERVKKDLS